MHRRNWQRYYHSTSARFTN